MIASPTYRLDPLVSHARSFALKTHGGQRYGAHPYQVHLDAVAQILAPFGVDAQIAGYLHDTLEDTAATQAEITARFGSYMAAVVALLTDEAGANRKERKAKTYAKLAAVGADLQLALLVKVGDRLANVRASVADRNEGLLEMYRGEHQAFRAAAYRPGLCSELWRELDQLLAAPLVRPKKSLGGSHDGEPRVIDCNAIRIS